MHIVDLHARIKQIVRQVLRHALGERGHKHALVTRRALANLIQQVVNLAAHGSHVDLGVEQARRTNDLLHVVLRHAKLVITGRCRNIDKLRDTRLELIETQGSVVERRGQTKAVLHQRHLAGAVALVHAANLRHRDMALVDNAKHVLGEVIDKRKRRFSGAAPIEVTRIVLDARAKTHRLEQLKVVIGSLLQALRLEQLVLGLELGHALLALLLDGLESRRHLGLLGHVVRSGPHRDGVVLTQQLTCDLIDLGNELYLVAKELKAQGVLRIRRIDINHIATHAKRTARKVIVIAIVLNINQRVDKIIALERHLLIHVGSQARIVLRAADTVNARDARNHNHIAARKKRCRRLMTQHLDLFVNGRVLLDIRVALRNIRFRLIVVVVRDEVDHGIIGEKLA